MIGAQGEQTSVFCDLTGKVALVTGSGRGLGKAAATALAAAGAEVALVSRTESEVEAAAAEIGRLGRKARPFVADVSGAAAVRDLVEKILKGFGTIDILVNNAGTALERPLLGMQEKEWDQVFAVNLKAAFLCSQAVGPEMIRKRHGKIINISSVAAWVGIPSLTAYCASKAGLLQFTRALALEWARYNIQVNALCPGYFRTRMNESFFATEAGEALIRHTIPMQRLGEPRELSGAILFLTSEASSFMTGAALVVDGGQTAG